MSTGRKIILILLALTMLVVMVCTWGSLGSACMGLGLVVMGSALLHQKFLINQDNSEFGTEV